jgi:phytoene dehydrogenase-like protein
MAPEGKTAAVVSYYTKKGEFWINLRKSDRHQYRAVKSQFQEIILTELDKRLGGIRDKVEEMDFATPASVLRYTNNWKGSAQGWLPSNNLFELYNIGFYLPGLHDFFYSSHWSQPGGGLPVAAKQGRDVAKEICKKYKVPFKTS